MTCTATEGPAAECPWCGDGWQPIETAPKGVEHNGKKAMSWMMLSWPDGEGGYHVESGMRVGDQFFAASTFYSGGPFDGKQYTLREVEVFPTHWMPRPAAPGAAKLPPPTVAEAARVLLGDDASVAMMARAVHDGPLMASEHAFDADTQEGVWCVDVVRAALHTLAGEGQR